MTTPIGAGPLHHVGIVVPSLAEAVPFYRDVLGYSAGREHELIDQRVKVVFVVGKKASRVELLEPTDQASGVARFLAERGRATVHHLCFEVADLRGALDRLANDGVELVDRVPRTGVEGQVAFLHRRAAGGVLIELLQRSR